jgi:hypothetical protein
MKIRFGFMLTFAVALAAGCGDGGKNNQLPRAPASNNEAGKTDGAPAKSGKQEGSKPQSNFAPL